MFQLQWRKDLNLTMYYCMGQLATFSQALWWWERPTKHIFTLLGVRGPWPTIIYLSWALWPLEAALMVSIAVCVQLPHTAWCMRLKHVFSSSRSCEQIMESHDDKCFQGATTHTHTLTQKVKSPWKGKVSPHASKGRSTSVECFRECSDFG